MELASASVLISVQTKRTIAHASETLRFVQLWPARPLHALFRVLLLGTCKDIAKRPAPSVQYSEDHWKLPGFPRGHQTRSEPSLSDACMGRPRFHWRGRVVLK